MARTESVSYTNNKRNGFTYDAAGSLTNDLGQTFTYDATGQQVTASYGGYSLQQFYDGDRLRVKKVENGTPTYYLRSSVLGGQVVAEFNASGGRTRGYVYLGGEILAVQQNNQVSWMHQDRVCRGGPSLAALLPRIEPLKKGRPETTAPTIHLHRPTPTHHNPFRVQKDNGGILIPRVSKQTPWAEISEHLRCIGGISTPPRVSKRTPALKISEHLQCYDYEV